MTTRRQSIHQPMPRHALSILFLAVLVCLVPTAPASAQFEVPLPKAISGQEVEAYGRQLNLSRAQRQAMERLYQDYLESFNELQRREIAPALRELQMRLGRAMGGQIDEFDAVHRGRKLLEGTIAAADEAFFDEVASILSEEQAPMLDRIRLMRERHRYAQHPFINLGRSRANLAEMIDDLVMHDDEAAEVNAIVAEYERALTRLYQRIQEEAATLLSDQIKAMLEREWPADGDDAEELAGAFESVQEIQTRLMRERHGGLAAVLDLNRRTYQRLAEVMSPESARPLREAFYTSAYRETGSLFNLPWEPLYDTALNEPDLDEAERRAIANSLDMYLAAQDQLIEAVADNIHRFETQVGGVFAEREEIEEHRLSINAHRQRSMELSNEAIEALREALGDHRFRELQAAHRDRARRQHEQRTGGWEQPEAWRVFESDPTSFLRRPYTFIPRPIDRTDLRIYARLLQLSEDEIEVLDVLHENYMERHEETIPDLLSEWRALYQRMNSHEPDLDPVADVDAMHDATSRVVRAIEQLDLAFFSDVEETLVDDDDGSAMNVIRLMRSRDVHHPFNIRYRQPSRNTTRIDLARLLALMPQSHRVNWPAVMPVLEAYQQAILPHVVARCNLERETSRELQRLGIEATHLHRAGAPMAEQLEVDIRRGRMSERIQPRKAAAGMAISTIQRETLPLLLERLPADVADSFEEHYTKIAFSNIYSQELPVGRLLREAQQLPDLNAAQRQQIAELTAEYHAAYARVIERMLEISRRADRKLPPGGGYLAEESEAMIAAARDRARLQQATIRQLRILLEHDQIARIAGWPSVDAERAAINVIP